MDKFVLMLHPEHIVFVQENYLPFVQGAGFQHDLEKTNEFFTYLVDPQHYTNPLIQAIATTFLFCRLNARLEGRPEEDAPYGVTDALIPFYRKG